MVTKDLQFSIDYIRRIRKRYVEGDEEIPQDVAKSFISAYVSLATLSIIDLIKDGIVQDLPYDEQQANQPTSK